jgi:DNA-binding response OmpR family regulator
MPADILVVDDDPTALLLLTRIVEMTGRQTDTARDGQEALDKIRELHPALVLIDIMMPKIDGFQVCEQIRQDTTLRRQPYIIMLTARDQAGDYQRARDIGVNEIINKPYSPATVSARVQAVLPPLTDADCH